MIEIRHLDWDSLTFGYPVGRLDLSGDMDRFLLEKLIWDSGMRLTYVFSEHPIPWLEPVDVKMTYAMELSDVAISIPAHRVSPLGTELTEHVRLLAHASGEYSRFRTDPGFNKGEFDLLYDLWISNSVSRRIAEEVLVTHDGDMETGMISLERENARTLRIGLAAVHPMHRGKGIGKALIAASVNFALENGYAQFTVATQQANLPARALYERTGFALRAEQYIYHVWQQ
ncbi:MAG: GNAT family N-acetyltransferase [Flavobacteriales bacterium]|nr:GNAT family N-acetyltransferase [Flavobacteriales bacterium]